MPSTKLPYIHGYFENDRWKYEYRKSPFKNQGVEHIGKTERHSLTVRKESIIDDHPPSKAYATARRYYRDLEKRKKIKGRMNKKAGKTVPIPPNATEVWINPDQKAKVLATFIDSRGRKQYRYNEQFLRAGQKEKFKRLEGLAKKIHRIRRRVDKELAWKRWSREKVTAILIRLIDRGYFRVGT
jgi:hypothetical protein